MLNSFCQKQYNMEQLYLVIKAFNLHILLDFDPFTRAFRAQLLEQGKYNYDLSLLQLYLNFQSNLDPYELQLKIKHVLINNMLKNIAKRA